MLLADRYMLPDGPGVLRIDRLLRGGEALLCRWGDVLSDQRRGVRR